MSITQKFLPPDALIEGKTFYTHNWKQLSITETRFYDYLEQTVGGTFFTDEEIHSIQTASALIDALSKTQLNEFNQIESWHHVFNVFYKAPDSDEWKLQFANSAYLEKIEANLSEKLESTEAELMKCFYRPETIKSFTTAANNQKGGYTAQFIEMDNIEIDEYIDGNGNKVVVRPAFFWYRKEFNHPDGWKIQIRIGMNGTELSSEQKSGLVDAYKLADILRKQSMDLAHYAKPSYEVLIKQIKDRLSTALRNNEGVQQRKLIDRLSLIQMILEVVDDIVKNSPFPLTVVDEKWKIEQISPAYVAMVGYKVAEILKPNFFKKIYPGVEGDMVKQSIIYYNEHGYYPEDASFIVSRWSAFHVLERKNNFNSLSSIELIPSPYSIDERMISMKIIDIMDSAITNSTLVKIVSKILTRIRNSASAIDDVNEIISRITIETERGISGKVHIGTITNAFVAVLTEFDSDSLTEIIKQAMHTEAVDIVINNGTIRLNTARPLESILDISDDVNLGNLRFETGEVNKEAKDKEDAALKKWYRDNGLDV